MQLGHPRDSLCMGTGGRRTRLRPSASRHHGLSVTVWKFFRLHAQKQVDVAAVPLRTTVGAELSVNCAALLAPPAA